MIRLDRIRARVYFWNAWLNCFPCHWLSEYKNHGLFCESYRKICRKYWRRNSFRFELLPIAGLKCVTCSTLGSNPKIFLKNLKKNRFEMWWIEILEPIPVDLRMRTRSKELNMLGRLNPFSAFVDKKMPKCNMIIVFPFDCHLLNLHFLISIVNICVSASWWRQIAINEYDLFLLQFDIKYKILWRCKAIMSVRI